MDKFLENFAVFMLKDLNIYNVSKKQITDSLTKYKEKLIPKQTKYVIPSMELINWIVASYFKINSQDLRSGETKVGNLTNVRQLSYYIMMEDFNFSCETIGKFYRRDHATVLHGKKKVKNNILIYKKDKEQYLEIMKILKPINNGNNNTKQNTDGSTERIPATQ